MVWVAFFVPLTLVWNLIMVSGMLGGRVNTPWPRRMLTILSITFFAVWFAGLLLYAVLVARAATRSEAFVALCVSGGPALVAGTVLMYVEYVIAGRRNDFRSDLLRIRWFGH